MNPSRWRWPLEYYLWTTTWLLCLLAAIPAHLFGPPHLAGALLITAGGALLLADVRRLEAQVRQLEQRMSLLTRPEDAP